MGRPSPRALLEQFELDGVRIPLVGPSGIWKPAACELPISVTTNAERSYADVFDVAAGAVRYAYRGLDLQHRDNRGLRRAWHERVPIAYFHAVERGGMWLRTRCSSSMTTLPCSCSRCRSTISRPRSRSGTMATWWRRTTRNRGDRTLRRQFDGESIRSRFDSVCSEPIENDAALCRLGHQELLDAAHITPDSDISGEPVVSDGLALCRARTTLLSIASFAVRPDYVIEVRQSILEETDGPMLTVGLQEIHGSRIELPSRSVDLPDPARLAMRYEEFRLAS